MCGIAGLAAANGRVSPRLVHAMTTAIRHRGPDDEGFVLIDSASGRATPLSGPDSSIAAAPADACDAPGDVCLGHRRLSILDLSPAGHQPMGDAHGNWLVFNGEIYNYREIRATLEDAGYRFVSGSDTEVLLAAYDAWGMACVERFNGMWAFVIYDARRRRLFGSRDRFGVKPLYLRRTADGGLAFASEIKGLLTLGPTGVNEPLLWDYLVLGYVEHTDETLFTGVSKLAAGHSFTYDLRDGAFAIERYYTLPVDDTDEPFSEPRAAALADEIRALVEDAVRLRLRADVDVGGCASGGLDSSIIAVIAARLREGGGAAQHGRQHLFTATFPGLRIDEARFAELVARETHAVWHTTTPSRDALWEDLRDLVRVQEEPFGSTSIYAQYRVMRLAAEAGIRVLLDGQGADELFGGYLPFIGIRQWELARRGAAGDLLRLTRDTSRRYSARMAVTGPLRAGLFDLFPADRLLAVRSRAKPFLLRMIAPEFLAAYRDRIAQYKEHNRTGTLNAALQERMTGLGLQGLLRYEDRNAMRWSIESRTPFADDTPLIETMFRTPAAYKVHAGIPKYLLRRAFDSTLPAAVAARRDKVGFATPEQLWLSQSTPQIDDLLELASGSAIVDTRFLRDNLATVVAGQRGVGITDLWRPLNYIMWRDVFAGSIA